MNALLTPADLAVLWGCSKRTVEREIRDGNLVASKIAGKWRIRIEDADRYVKASANVRRRAK